MLATNSDTSTKEYCSSLNSDGRALEPSKGSAFCIKDVPLGDEGGHKPVVSAFAYDFNIQKYNETKKGLSGNSTALHIAQLLSLENTHVNVMLLKSQYEVSLLEKEKELACNRLSAACAKCNISEQDPWLWLIPCRYPFQPYPRSTALLTHSTPIWSTWSTWSMCSMHSMCSMCSTRSTLSTCSTSPPCSPCLSSSCSDCSGYSDSSETYSSSNSFHSFRLPKSPDCHATASTSKREWKGCLSKASPPQLQKRMWAAD